MTATLRVLVVGAGAIGTYLGGTLALGRQAEVTFLVRPPTATRLRDLGGLRLHRPDGEHVLPLDAYPRTHPTPAVALTTDPTAISRTTYDLVLLAVKTYHLPDFLESIRPVEDDFPPVVCLLNGVEAEAHLAARLGAERVLAGTVTTAVGRLGPGQARVEKARGVGLAAGHPYTAPLAQALTACGVTVRTYANADAMKWSKLLTNLTANATSAILDLPPAAIYAHPGLARLEVAMLREALAVMHALRLPVVDLPGAPVRLLAWGLRWLPFPLLRPLLQRVVGGGRGGKMPSFHVDLHGGRGMTEVDALNGAVVRFGMRLGVPTPVNRLLNETLTALTEGRLAMETFRHRPEALLERWRSSANGR